MFTRHMNHQKDCHLTLKANSVLVVVADADSDTGFGRGNGAVDLTCNDAETDDVGSIVRMSESLVGSMHDANAAVCITKLDFGGQYSSHFIFDMCQRNLNKFTAISDLNACLYQGKK